MTARSRAAVHLVLCAVLWSTGGLLIKSIAWPALAVAGLRSALAAVVLMLALREWRPRWSWWLVSGALAGAASMLGFVLATKLTTAANAIFLVYTAPLYVALLSPWVLREPIHGDDWLTLLLAMLGMGCFCFEQLTWDGWVGNLCALGSGLATAWLVVCLRKHTATSPLLVLMLANTLVAVVGVPFMFTVPPDPVSWGLLLLAGVGQLGVPLVLYGSNRSGCENRNHAAACDFCTLAGSRDGAASPRRAASHAVVRYSKTLRCCCFRVATTVCMLSTKREPSALCVPKLPLRQSTPGRIALSAVLLVGSTPSTCTNVHNAWRRFRMARHVPAVLGTPHRLPASNSRSTSRRSGLIYDRNVERCRVPSRTRCHHANSWCTCASKAVPISSECPPRPRIASQSRRKCAQHS